MVPQHKGKWKWTGGLLGAVEEVRDPRQEGVQPGKRGSGERSMLKAPEDPTRKSHKGLLASGR